MPASAKRLRGLRCPYAGSLGCPGQGCRSSTTTTATIGTAPDIGADEFSGIFADGFESVDTSAWSTTVQ